MAESSPFQPVGGLGSYKGVMLCNRPPEEGAGGGGLLPGGGQAPFKSMVSATASDRLGLPPARRPEDPSEDPSAAPKSKFLGPCAALRRHCQWIKELQQQVQDDQRQVEMDAAAQLERKQRLAVTYKKQRDAIQRVKKEKTAAFLEPAEVAAILNPKAAKRGLPGQKPMWAMTEEEKDGAEDEDAALLIQFAQDLDFDKYINDIEFKQQLKVVRDRAKHLQKQQDDFKDALVREFNTAEDPDDLDAAELDADAVSTCDSASAARRPPMSGIRRAAEDERPAWDGSTVCSEKPVDPELQGLAEQALERNPQLRAVHSKGSVQRMVEKARSATPSVAASA
mmetsp:Transcript_2599/g.5601  ORF Transcript_2599/g.5601 Transcript_2599/m.5601 type:complete len:338 (+) Transcript_2599:687-1700(+)